MVLKRKDPGRTFSPSRSCKALSRSGLGLCRSPRRGLSTSFHTPSKPTPSIRPGGRQTSAPKGASANMKVIVRVRPLSHRELENNARIIVDAVDSRMVVFDPKKEEESFFFHGSKQKGRDISKKVNKNAQFLFDRVFGSEASNEEVFEGSTKSIVSSVLDGFNCSVFVYGATGAGKTYTMLGTQDNPGITFRTMVDLFQQMEKQKNEKDFEIGASYLEVYKETVKDLLSPSSPPLALRDDGGGVKVAGLKLEKIADPNRMFQLLEFGNKNRSQHPTDANAESSRSHAVFQVFIKMKTKANGQTKLVKLSMIDLAGSERGAATGCSGVRFKEGSNINKSLLALGNCINALADGLRFVPYRDSKLTRLLKDSLGGNCQTVMIANVAPAHYTYEDTHNTLKYATRAKSIKFQIKRNIVSVDLHVSHYIKMVEDLQTENERLKQIEAENICLKQEFEEYKSKYPPHSEMPAPLPEPTVIPSSPKQSHLPPVVAAAVAAINNKAKPVVETSTVAVNTSPCKPLFNSEDLIRLKNEAQKLYYEKSQLHQRYLNMDSSDKVLRLRIKMKQRIIDNVLAMSNTPSRMDKAQTKVDNSLGQFNGRLASVHEYQEALTAEEEEINLRLEKVRHEMQRLGMFEEIEPYLTAFELEFLNQDLSIKCQNLEKLVECLDREYKRQDDLIKKFSTTFRHYYYLVKGHGHMTEEMSKEHEILMRDIEGVKAVKWKQENDDETPVVRTLGTTMKNGLEIPKQHASFTTSHDSVKYQSIPVKDELSSPARCISVQEVKSPPILQSPLCSSSSISPSVSKPMDTASILNSLGMLDSKVENILNTSVTSSAVEISDSVHEPLCSADDDEKAKALNVTFDAGAEANLNATFNKDILPEAPGESCNLNETFEKVDEIKFDLPIIPSTVQESSLKLNGTFSLEEKLVESNIATEKESYVALENTDSLPSPAPPSSASISVKGLSAPSTVSPSLLKPPSSLSPSLLKPPSTVSPSKLLAAKITFTSSSPSLATSSIAISKKPTYSPTIPASNVAPSRKVATAVSSPPTFAVPNTAVPALSTKPVVGLKRPVSVVNGDKRKALASNLGQRVPLTKPLGISRKPVGLGVNIRLNTGPSKVKLAWNKENRTAAAVNLVKPLATPKALKSIPFPKPAALKIPVVPSPLNGTFTKEPSTS